MPLEIIHSESCMMENTIYSQSIIKSWGQKYQNLSEQCDNYREKQFYRIQRSIYYNEDFGIQGTTHSNIYFSLNNPNSPKSGFFFSYDTAHKINLKIDFAFSVKNRAGGGGTLTYQLNCWFCNEFTGGQTTLFLWFLCVCVFFALCCLSQFPFKDLPLQNNIKAALILLTIKHFDLHNIFTIKDIESVLPSSTISINTKQIYFV